MVLLWEETHLCKETGNSSWEKQQITGNLGNEKVWGKKGFSYLEILF